MKHWKKMVAPIIVAIIIVLYYIGIALFMIAIPGSPVVFRILVVVVSFILTAVMIGVLISRIKEIRGGEEDDLSKY